jgi:hypothetical protein
MASLNVNRWGCEVNDFLRKKSEEGDWGLPVSGKFLQCRVLFCKVITPLRPGKARSQPAILKNIMRVNILKINKMNPRFASGPGATAGFEERIPGNGERRVEPLWGIKVTLFRVRCFFIC